MCTRFHALGFDCHWSQDTAREIARIAVNTRRELDVKGGFYRVHRSHSGFELWFHYPNQRHSSGRESRADPADFNSVKGMTPFHAGVGRMEMLVRTSVRLDRNNPLTGAFTVDLMPKVAGDDDRRCTIEMVPFAAHPQLTGGVLRAAQVVCLAADVAAHESEASYRQSVPAARRLPVGALRPVTEEEVKERSLGYRQRAVGVGQLVGKALRSVRLTNPISRQPYYWLVLETVGGPIDVLANPESIKGDISVGAIVEAFGSLVGRLEGV